MDFNKLNSHLKQLDVDYLYHIGIDTTMDLSIFNDLEYIVFVTTDSDALLFASMFAKDNNIYQFKGYPIFKTERYHLYKVGPVLAISYGIGAPSLLICLNEVAKLVYHINKPNIKFLKIGRADGIGDIDIGALSLVDRALDSKLDPVFYSLECGVKYSYPTTLDNSLLNDIQQFGKLINYKLVTGSAIGSFSDYEEQACMDGFLPLVITAQDRDLFLTKAIEHNVKTLSTDVTAFASFCNELTISACALDVVIVKRTNTDVLPLVLDLDKQYIAMSNACSLVSKYIAHKLHLAK